MASPDRDQDALNDRESTAGATAPNAQQLRGELAHAMAQFDGTTLGYVRYLLRTSDERLRELGAI